VSNGVAQPTTGPAARPAPARGRRTAIRYAAALLAVAVGVLYLLIALQVIHVADTTGKDSPFIPMMAAAVAFWLGAVLLAVIDRRIVWLLGAAVQVVVLIGYVAVAPSRDPHVEAWGLLIKLAQIVILGSLVYLTVTWSRDARRSMAGPRPVSP